ncbi:MAG: peroxiredoxin-like family protein [Balneolaceae bacterium]
MKIIAVAVFLLFAGCNSSEPKGQSTKTAEDAFSVRPLLIGESIPDVAVTDTENNEHSIAELIKEKPTLIIFYRGGWCPFCSAHLLELASLEEDIYELGYQILAISPDQPEFLNQTLEDQDLSYTLLSDSPMEAARAFGVAYREDDETVAGLKSNGMDIVQRSGHDHQQLPVPAVYIADTSSKILFQYVNPDYRERISGEILLAALKVFHQE